MASQSGKKLIGIGVDAQYMQNYPGGLEGLKSSLSDRLSHISIVSLRTESEARTFRREIANDLKVVHHLSNIAPADPEGPHLARLRIQNELSFMLGAEWCCEDIGIWSLGPYEIPYFAPPVLTSEIADLVGNRIREINSVVDVPFLMENPSFSYVAGDLSLAAFFNKLVEIAENNIVMDLSHIYSYALYKGEDPMCTLADFPCDQVWEIHIAGGRIDPVNQHRYLDTHSHNILPPVLKLLPEAIRRCSNLRAITYEIGAKLPLETLLADFEKIERVAREYNFSPTI